MVVLYLGRDGLDFQGKNRKIHLDFPSNLVDNLQLKNELDLAILVKNFLTANKIFPDNLQIVLNQEVLYSKEFRKVGDTRENIDKFYDQIPFSPKNLAKIEVETPQSILVFAANNEVFEFLAKVLSDLGFNVLGAYPQSLMLDKKVFTQHNMLRFKKQKIPLKKLFIILILAVIGEIIISLKMLGKI